MNKMLNKSFIEGLAADIEKRDARLKVDQDASASGLLGFLDRLTEIDVKKAANTLDLESNEKITAKTLDAIASREIRKQFEALGSGLTFSEGKYYVYADGYWQYIETGLMQALLAKAAIKLGMKRHHYVHYERQEKLQQQFNADVRAERLVEFNLEPPKNSKRKVLINFENGTLEIDGDSLDVRDPCPADFLRYKLPYEYDRSAKCPLFMQFLNKSLPDESSQKVLAEFVGNALWPVLNLQKALILLGEGSNGKSVFFEIVKELLGRDNVSNYSIEGLTKHDSRTRGNVGNKLINCSNEAAPKLDIENLKTMARGEPIEVNQKYEQPYTMENYARLMFNCNQLPRNVEHTEGYYRTFLIIPFNVRITEAEKDPMLAAKITAKELPGVFNWVLEGLLRLQKTGKYTDCKAAGEALANYKKESNSALMFIDESGLKPALGTAGKITRKSLYAEYCAFCEENGYFKQASITFSKTLCSAGFIKKRDKDGYFFNIIRDKAQNTELEASEDENRLFD